MVKTGTDSVWAVPGGDQILSRLCISCQDRFYYYAGQNTPYPLGGTTDPRNRMCDFCLGLCSAAEQSRRTVAFEALVEARKCR